MRKYFILQLKRLLRILPPVLIVAGILFGCLCIVYDASMALNEESGQQTKFKVGIVGTAGDSYLQMGLTAVESFDSTRFTVEFEQMSEPEAERAMIHGDIAAYVVIPDGFMDAALYGDIMPLKYVSTAGSVGLVSMLKDELTQIIEVMLIESQKGTYGAGNAVSANGGSGSKVIGEISIQYVDFVLSRSKLYTATELGIFDGLGMGGYLLSGLGIVLFMLICLTFAPVMIRRDPSLARMLSARRKPAFAQVLCDFAVYMLGLLAIALIVLLLIVFRPDAHITLRMILQCLPALFALGAMSFLMYEAVTDMVSGVLLQFFITLALCFVSGCLYPIAFFPDSVQKLSCVLPTGLARLQMANCILGKTSVQTTAALLGFGCLFLAVAVLIRKIRVAGVRG